MIHIESDPKTPIYYLNPHYTDRRFEHPQTVYLAEGLRLGKFGRVKAADYEHSDRLWQWGWETAHNAAERLTKTGVDLRTAGGIEKWLRLYYRDKSVRLVHVMAGFNLATGYPYQVYGFLKGQVQS